MDADEPVPDRSHGQLDRRRFLALASLVVGVGVAGCGSGSETPDPVSLDDGQHCDQCGMVIQQHAGPVGQTYYEGDRPEGRDGPAWFCSSVCLYRYQFAAEEGERTRTVSYLTDYSGVDYTIEGDDEQFISAHLGAEFFEPIGELTLVVRSEIQGAMGPAMVPFSDEADARDFSDEYGGDLIEATAVSRELLDA